MTESERRALLGDLQPGDRGTIVEISDDLDEGADEADKDWRLENRLREVGFVEGAPVEVLHESPFGADPISVHVDQMTIALRRKEARAVMVALDTSKDTAKDTAKDTTEDTAEPE